MNPNLCRVVLRPRTPLAVFDLTWRFLAQRWQPFLRLFAVVYLPLWLLSLPIAWLTDWHWGVGIGVVALSWMVRLPFTLLAGRLMFADTVSLRSVLWDCVRRTPMVAMAGVVHLMALMAGAATCGISLFLSAGGLAWLSECILLEQRVNAGPGGGWTAARRSWHLATQGAGAAMAAIVGTVFLTLWFAALGEAGAMEQMALFRLHAQNCPN